MSLTELEPFALALRLACAAAIGLVVGTEREWSGSTEVAHRRFAGLRTFFMFGILGGIAGLMFAVDIPFGGGVLLAGGMAFNIVAYTMSVRRPDRELDGTTEAAALVVIGLGTLAGLGFLGLASGCGAIVVFALGEKEKLHWLVSRIGKPEMHAALEFLVLAVVILPLLPMGPYGDVWMFRPRALWGIVLILSGINFFGYLARRAVGPGRGYGVTGALAGLISSTALTLQFARTSKEEPQHAKGLALGVMAACSVLPIRVIVISATLNPDVAVQVLRFAIPAMLIGLVSTLLLYRDASSAEGPSPEPQNPLRLLSALELALIFEAAFVVIGLARRYWGNSGLTGSSVLLGLADLDALTVSVNRLPGDTVLATVAARAIGIGLLTNTVVKLAIAMTLGNRTFRKLTTWGLVATTVGLALVLWWRW